jgi:hypothetical protein
VVTVCSCRPLISVHRLWVHEALRVFYDRLTDDADRRWLYGQLRDCVQENFKENFDVSLDTLPTENGTVSWLHDSVLGVNVVCT